MTVYELNRDQMDYLKRDLVTTRALEERGECPYMSELADAAELISDEEIFESYDGIEFFEEDFFC